jgi:hypothetical protein
MPFQYDPLYWIIIAPAVLVMLFAQWRIKTTFNRWSREPNEQGISGNNIARTLLSAYGMPEVTVEGTSGHLSDHYNPVSNILRLSESTIHANSVAAMAVAAHEVGHAQQDFKNSLLMRLRMGIVPLVNLGSQLGPVVFIVGLGLQASTIMWVGIILFSSAFVFALITLPVEIDASRRAMKMLQETDLITTHEDRRGARAVLTAAAWTYVAGMLNALFQVIYFIILALSGRRRGESPA